MLVQLSPWDVVRTSFRVPSQTTRRRKAGGKEAVNFPFGASFVTKASLRSRQKRMRYSGSPRDLDSLPLLTITSSHRVSVIGRSMKDKSYEENARMQYASRPGIASSFFNTPQNGQSLKDSDPIPALLDAKNDRLYAFQHSNGRLCTWDAYNSTGPDSDSSLKVELRQRALSISLLPIYRGVVYGTCADGSLYFAKVVHSSGSQQESISVEYLPGKQSQNSQYVGTVAEIISGKNVDAGKKRKSSDPEIVMALYQVFCEDSSFLVVRHDVMCCSGSTLLLGATHVVETMRIDVSQTLDGKLDDDWRIEQANLLVSSSGFSSGVAVAYTLRPKRYPRNSNKKPTNLQFCASLSLNSARLSRYPLPLPSTMKQAQLVMDNLLIVATNDRIILYDLRSGVSVKEVEVVGLVGESTETWLLCADARLSTLALVFPKDGCLQAAFATTCIEGSDVPLTASKLSLANRLSTSLTQLSTATWNRVDDNRTTAGGIELCCRGCWDLREDSRHAIEKALERLDSARCRILRTQEIVQPHFFLDCYDGVVSTFQQCCPPHDTDSLFKTSDVAKNGVSGALGEKSKQNIPPIGCNADLSANCESCKKRRDGSGGLREAINSGGLPQRFVDGALVTTLSLLLNDRQSTTRVKPTQLEAGVVLSRLLRTRKVSARIHFEVGSAAHNAVSHDLSSILLSLKLPTSNGSRAYSPVDFIFDLLRYCQDISERQMVTMLSYVLSRALADDVAEAFTNATFLNPLHSGKIVSRRYFRVRDRVQTSAEPKSGCCGDQRKPDEISKLSRRVILEGASFLLQRFSLYSQCNEAMLRAALTEGLSRRQAILLAGLLSKLISNPSSASCEHVPTSSCRWISALADCYRDALILSTSTVGINRLSSIHRSLVFTVGHYEAALSLQDDVTRLQLGPRKKSAIKKKQQAQVSNKAKKKETEEDIPGYTVDHLSF